MDLKFKITFKRGPETVAEVVGYEKSSDHLTLGEMEKVIPTEQFLEKLTGLRVHIEQVQ